MINSQIEFNMYNLLTLFVLLNKIESMKTIGKEWTKKEEGGTFTADHLSPSQLNKSLDIWFNDYIILTAKQRKSTSLKFKYGYRSNSRSGSTGYYCS
jgi:hypothetical protein